MVKSKHTQLTLCLKIEEHQGCLESCPLHHWIIAKKTSNTNTLGLIVEFAPPIIHMHVYLNYKKNPPSKHIYKNKMHMM